MDLCGVIICIPTRRAKDPKSRYVCPLAASCSGEEHNAHLLTHSLHPSLPHFSPSPSHSFSLDAICPPWYSDALPESRVSRFFPSVPQFPPPCIFNGHTRATDKWFLFLTGEGGLQLHRDGERGSNTHPQEHGEECAHAHTSWKQLGKKIRNALH